MPFLGVNVDRGFRACQGNSPDCRMDSVAVPRVVFHEKGNRHQETHMICPACNGRLSEMTIENIKLDVCKDGCGGIWFDRFELQKMDEPHEFTDENLMEILSFESKTAHDDTKRYDCPKCGDVIMMRHFYSVKRAVEIDHCPKCAGYWLDEGELFKIRSQFESEADRQQAALAYFGSVFDDELAVIRAESREKAEHARRIANMFKLISPRYYHSKIKS